VHPLPVEFIIETVVLVILLIIICYIKGEKPKWQWGIDDENKNLK
jgi:hypothetical protein